MSDFSSCITLKHVILSVIISTSQFQVIIVCISVIKSKSNLYYTCLISFRVSRVRGAHLRSFASGPTLRGCSSGELLPTCGRFDRLKTIIG